MALFSKVNSLWNCLALFLIGPGEVNFYLLFISGSWEKNRKDSNSHRGPARQRGTGGAFVQDIKSQSIPLWAWWRVLQAISRGSLLGANLHVYFPRTLLRKMNGVGHVPNSSSSKLHFSSSYTNS